MKFEEQHAPVVPQVTRYDIKLTVIYVRALMRAHVTVFWRESDGQTESTHERKCLKQFSSRDDFDAWRACQRMAGYEMKTQIIETSKDQS